MPCERERELEFGRLIHWCSHLIRLRMNERLQRYDLTPVQAHVILYLTHLDAQECVNQRELGEMLHVKPSTVNGIVERLEARGFLTRRPGADARCRTLSATDKGLALEGALAKDAEENERLLLRGFSAQEEAQFRAYLLRMMENLSEEMKEQ